MNVFDFKIKKEREVKISMVSCYDYSQARILEQTGIDALLVGDSVAMVVHGHPSTVYADVEMMTLHTAAVRRGTTKFLVADMPFLSYRKGEKMAMEAVERLMKVGANAIKLEGVNGNEKIIKHIVESGVPVMGHLGFTPQSVHQFGGFKVQGKNHQDAEKIIQEAMILQDLGAFSIVLECVPSSLSFEISKKLLIPTIGIGAGVYNDGQILVFNDLLGMDLSFKPKFLRTFADSHSLFVDALNSFHQGVINGSFPNQNESY